MNKMKNIINWLYKYSIYANPIGLLFAIGSAIYISINKQQKTPSATTGTTIKTKEI